MADVKISALPAASTPLAGTEVLPIVQGGITEKVSVANLTAGRDVSVNSLIVTSNITINGSSVVDQTDTGTAPNEIPLNQYLGNLAYQDAANIAGNVGVGGALTVQAGTAALPSIAPTGDSNTGIYFPAADTIGFAAGGVIGFSVGTTASAVNYLEARGAATGNSPRIVAIGSDANVPMTLLAKGTGEIRFNTNALERMRIDGAGNVGIGTTTPNASALLDVQSTTQGVRMPNMTTTQKNAIASPAAGLMVFDTTLSKLAVYTGAAWETITSI
jgi:hypothetical protein